MQILATAINPYGDHYANIASHETVARTIPKELYHNINVEGTKLPGTLHASACTYSCTPRFRPEQ